MLLHVFVSPMAAYFMTLLWAALFGNTFGDSNLMVEEWIFCIQIYLFIVILLRFKRPKPEV